ncbi:MAG: hypothetical protein KDA78_04430 [Planctomycetaceae bacterium]|nr:hypothetical protein [Planctomycetaceae bacterium]
MNTQIWPNFESGYTRIRLLLHVRNGKSFRTGKPEEITTLISLSEPDCKVFDSARCLPGVRARSYRS